MNALKKWDTIVGSDFVWKVIARAGIASLDNVMDSILIILGFLVIVILTTMGWSGFIIVLVFFNGWYILFILFSIGLRSNARTRLKGRIQGIEETSFISMPRFKDIILVYSLATISVFSLLTWIQLTDFATIFACIAIALNICALITVIHWLLEKEKRCRPLEHNDEERERLRKDLLRDRYRLYATIFVLGFPIIAAAKTFSALVVWIGIIGGIIFLCFQADFRERIQKQKAWVYASLLTGYMGMSISMVLGATMYGLPELTTFLMPSEVMFVILLAVYWLAVYRIKRRWKWK